MDAREIHEINRTMYKELKWNEVGSSAVSPSSVTDPVPVEPIQLVDVSPPLVAKKLPRRRSPPRAEAGSAVGPQRELLPAHVRAALDVGLDVNGVLLFAEGQGPPRARHATQDFLAKLLEKIGWEHLYVISWCGWGNAAT